MSELKERLDAMVHGNFVYRNEVVELLAYVLCTGDDENEYELMLSNGRTLTGNMNHLSNKLDEFISADKTISTVVDHRMKKVTSFDSDVMFQLRDAVLESIQNVRKDPKSVSQAKQIFQGVNTMINLAKTELEYRKYIDSLNKKR